MKRILMAAIALACITGGSAATLRAQDQTAPPPKVLLIIREMVKVGKGEAHAKNEAAFVRAFAAVKAPDRYLAVTTMSGPSEAWFLEGFDSFAEWEKTNKYDDQPKVGAAVGPIMEKDAEYIADGNQTVATFNEKWSYRPAMNVSEMRYFEVETIRLRPGHDKDWEDLVTLYNATAEKINMDEHDIFYEARYGAPAGTLYIFTPRKSLADLDAAMGAGKAFQDALGPDGQKKWAQLIEATIANDNTTLVEFSPEMSFPPEAWVKADPDYWKPKPMAAPRTPAPAMPKPAPAPATKN
ncbi:MAG TPA: hypothetical protein VN822_04090 [Candidatus Acidoferrales bacterium]|nr:hypothetical protein [Candidatus Acidoferrales bacterium]